MSYFIISSTLFCLIGNVYTFQLGANCGPLRPQSSEYCLRELSSFKKAFFTNQYGNTKEKVSFSDYLNHYKSAGYEFPKEAIETEADKFYRYANGGEWESICWGCGNGDGLMNLREMVMSKANYNRPT